MRRVIVGLAAVGIVPVLASCASGVPEVSDNAPPTETVTITVTAPADKTQDASTQSVPEGTEAPTSTEAEAAPEATSSVDEAESSDESERDFGAGKMSDRGYIQKELGQWAGIGEADDRLVDFRLTEIETDFACDQPYADSSANGQFVALTFEVQTYPSLADDEYFGDFTITEHDIIMFDDSGKRENDSTGNAYMCLQDSERLPTMIGPGQTAEGNLVIDTGVESGTLAVESYLLGGRGGWEWDFPSGGRD